MTTGPRPLPRVGDVLDGRYRIDSVIGSGGMATVYLALDEFLGRNVAVKAFSPRAAETVDAERVASETRLLASLNHHSLVTLFDAQLDGPQAYLVMEYVEGPTLAQRIANGPIPADEVAGIAIDLAEGLQVVHEARVVHRDVKPSNVLLRRGATVGAAPRAKLGDFGIASLVDGTRMTAPGTVIGTAAYLSPEQVRGADPDTPTDIYALGLVVLEALTGRRAFPQATTNEAMLARLSVSPEVPGVLGYAWKSLLTAMTALRPEDRPTAAEVVTGLRAVLASTTEPDTTAPATVSSAPAIPSSAGRTLALEESPTVVLDPTLVLDPTADARRGGQRADDGSRRARPRAWILAAGVVMSAAVLAIVIWASSLSGASDVPPAVESPAPAVVTSTVPSEPTAPAEPAVEPSTPVVDGTDDADKGNGNNGNGNKGNGNKGNGKNGNSGKSGKAK